MKNTIVSAIKNRNLLEISYSNQTRIIEPYCAGETSKGNFVIRAFQIENKQDLTADPSWKLFTVDKITSIKSLPNKFKANRDDYNPDDPAFQKIIARI